MLASTKFKSRSYHPTKSPPVRPYNVASAECLPVCTGRLLSSMVSGSTSLLMMRTRSVVRCRGIYRLRDTSRERQRERERRREEACKKRPRFIVGKFPSWRYFQKWWRTGSKKKVRRRSFSPSEPFAPRSAVVSYPQGSDTEKGADTPFTSLGPRSTRQPLCFRRIKDVAGARLSRGPQSIVSARLKNSWARLSARSRDDVDSVLIFEEICKMAFSRITNEALETCLYTTLTFRVHELHALSSAQTDVRMNGINFIHFSTHIRKQQHFL